MEPFPSGLSSRNILSSLPEPKVSTSVSSGVVWLVSVRLHICMPSISWHFFLRLNPVVRANLMHRINAIRLAAGLSDEGIYDTFGSVGGVNSLALSISTGGSYGALIPRAESRRLLPRSSPINARDTRCGINFGHTRGHGASCEVLSCALEMAVALSQLKSDTMVSGTTGCRVAHIHEVACGSKSQRGETADCERPTFRH